MHITILQRTIALLLLTLFIHRAIFLGMSVVSVKDQILLQLITQVLKVLVRRNLQRNRWPACVHWREGRCRRTEVVYIAERFERLRVRYCTFHLCNPIIFFPTKRAVIDIGYNMIQERGYIVLVESKSLANKCTRTRTLSTRLSLGHFDLSDAPALMRLNAAFFSRKRRSQLRHKRSTAPC